MVKRGAPFDFEEFYSAFSKSVAVNVSLLNGEIVLANEKDKSRVLVGNAQVGVSNAQRPVSAHDTPLPVHLAALVALQESDGSWKYSDKFQYVVQNVAPLPPEGISGKLWATAIAVNVLRQHPEFFAQLESTYDKATLHVDDDVLQRARQCVDFNAVDQIRPYQDNEAKAIRDRLAREAAAKRAEEEEEEQRIAQQREHELRITKLAVVKARRLPLDSQQLLLSALKTDLERVFPSRGHLKIESRPESSRLVAKELEMKVHDVAECCWRRIHRTKKPQVQSSWSSCKILGLDVEAQVAYVHFDDEPRERERNVPLLYVRLSRDDARGRRDLAFESLKGTWGDAQPLESELSRLLELERRKKWRKPWECRSLPSLPLSASSKAASDDQVETPRTVPPLVFHRPHTPDAILDELYQQAVAALLSYDKAYMGVHSTLRSATQLYANAVLFRDRFHAFDEFSDRVEQLMQRTVSALECIQSWKKYIRQEASASAQQPQIFVWKGSSFILSLIKSLDYLSAVRELVEWYGEDFAFAMNPFLLSDSIRDQVETRYYVFTKRMQFSPADSSLRTVLRMHKEEDGADQASSMPMWWPEKRYDAVLRERITRAEEFILQELQDMKMLRPRSKIPQ